MGKKKKQKQARPVVTDVSAVKNAAGEYVVSRSFSEVVDLLSEGVIEGLTSGDYAYVSKENETGYQSVDFSSWSATGSSTQPNKELGFLQSIYWNQIPVVDKDGFYNFPSVNVETTKGLPEGAIPNFNSLMNSYAGFNPAEDILDLSVNRPIGERLYGPEIKAGEDAPTDKISAQLKPGVKIDKYAKTYTVLNKELQKIAVNIKVNSLFESVQAGPKTYKRSSHLAKCNRASTGYGDQKARTIEYNIYYRPMFDQRFASANQEDKTNIEASSKWLGPIKETVTGKIDQPYVRSTIINLSDFEFSDSAGFEGWEVRIVRLTPEPLTSFYRAISFVDGFVEIYGTKLRYPYSSMTYSQFDARNFSRVPSRAYDTKLIKVKIPNNYNPLLKTYGNSSASVTTPADNPTTNDFTNPIGIAEGARTNSTYAADNQYEGKWSKASATPTIEWDGGFATVGGVATAEPLKAWTDNPAWCFYDLITNPRYGLGEHIKETQIDKWSLYEIAKYCDELVPDTYGSLEPRFTINYLITSREEAFKVLNDLTSIFRGIAYYSNGSIFAVQDRYKSAVYQFNNSNVIDGDFSYSSSSKRARHSVAIVRYNDKKNLFQPAIEYVEDEESVRRYGINEIETTALGCTSRGQARRFADWILKSEALETETVSFSVGADGSYLRHGDVVQIYDNFRSPLKYSGRTNAVIKGTPAITNQTPPANVSAQLNNKYSNASNFNTVILDQPLNFTSNKSYKFSLLTPTYNTATGDETEVRRSQIQTAIFSGADAMPITGNFRSDETGVCTQITFNTGTLFGGMDNAFDFDNYVITGYTNTGVWVKGTLENMTVAEQGYSGGCFSGENLIWSVEPTDQNDTEFISGHYSNYKIVNIKEEEDNYAISALAYSTGKYDLVEESITSPVNVDPPAFPTGDSPSTSSTLTSENLSRAALLNLSQDTAVLGAEGKGSTYKSIKIQFVAAAPSASYIFEETPASTASDQRKFYSIREDGFEQDQLAIKYAVALITDEDDVPASDRPSAAPASDPDPRQSDIKIINPSNYASYSPYVVELLDNQRTVNGTLNPHRGVFVENGNLSNADKMVTEYLTVPNVTVYWVAVFAISANGTCSYGMIRRVDGINPSISQSEIQSVSITKLTSEGIAVPKTVNNLDSVQPGFSWEVSNKGTLFSNASTESNHFPITIPDSTRQYRITLRKPPIENVNIPSKEIYMELTGYQSPSNDPNFVLEKFYNDPNSIKSIILGSGYGWKDGEAISNWTTRTDNQKYEEGDNSAQWFSASGIGTPTPEGNIEILGENYGLNINSGLANNFPLRRFDIVVEAEDANGNTSASNTPYANTLLQGTENYKPENSDNYDIFGVKIEAPSGVFFAQKPATDIGLTYNFIDPSEAGEKSYPYAAAAAVFPNGYLQIDLRPAVKADGTPTITEDEAEIFFNNTAGIIYYYTTGDNRIDYIDSKPVALNRAPEFTINPSEANLKAGEEKGVSNQIIKFVEGQDVEVSPAKAFGGLITLGDYKGNKADGLAGNVHRGYYLFGEGDSVDSLQIPFPNISQSSVENINLLFGFIDDLHILSSFEEDGDTPLFNGINAAKTPKIFAQNNINYSASVLDEGDFVSLTDQGGVYSNLFADNPGNSLFLNESSITSASDDSLAFRAWGEIKFKHLRRLIENVGVNETIIDRDHIAIDKVVTKNVPNLEIKLIGDSRPRSFGGKATSATGKITVHNLVVTIPGIASLYDKKKISVVLSRGADTTSPVQSNSTSNNQNYIITDKDITIYYHAVKSDKSSFTFGILVTNE